MTPKNKQDPEGGNQKMEGYCADSRATFLARVRHALGHSAQGAVAAPASKPPRREQLLRQVERDDPRRVERWISQAEKNGAKVQRSPRAGIVAAIDAALAATNVQSIMLNLVDFPEERIARHLAARGLQVHRWPDANCVQTVYQCDASITDCRYAMADTGAVLVCSDARFGRATTLTVPRHIVVVPAQCILADLIDALPRILTDNSAATAMAPAAVVNGREPEPACHRIPSNVVIINGPSKTTDIEMNLVTGVHGPKFLHAIVVDD